MFKLVVTFLCGLVGVVSALNNSPIIGIFSQPTDSTEGDCGGNCLYIPASYVKYIEGSGARVVPINYYATEAELDALLPSLNGVLFPGGDADFPKTAQYTFNKVKQFNDAGEYFPLWGTCMGFEWLLMSATENADILDPKVGQMDAYNLSIPLDFSATYKESKIFKQSSSYVTTILSQENVTMNNHHYGIWTKSFRENSVLTNFFHVLSTNKDRNGDEFVSMIEAFKYPIFGSQWHPEKNNFEWAETSEGIPQEAINHSLHAILASQYMGNFFVGQARLSQHKFPDEPTEDAALIYNYNPTKTTGSFVQEYYFHF